MRLSDIKGLLAVAGKSYGVPHFLEKACDQPLIDNIVFREQHTKRGYPRGTRERRVRGNAGTWNGPKLLECRTNRLVAQGLDETNQIRRVLLVFCLDGADRLMETAVMEHLANQRAEAREV